MSKNPYKDTVEVLDLIERAQSGDTRAENNLVKHYSTYTDYMVRRYSKKTEIKDDDDLRSCINLGLLYGIRCFKREKGALFIYHAHNWMKKSIYTEETAFRFIRIPVNQKVFYEAYRKNLSKALEEGDFEKIDEIEKSYGRFAIVDNSGTSLFTDISIFDEEEEQFKVPEHFLYPNDKEAFDKEEEKLSSEVLKNNINKVLSNFTEKEVYIIEHAYGLNGAEKISSEQIAERLGVTKVNITFTKTKVLRIMRHASLSNILLQGIR